jgi:hypothetical protein
MKTRTPMASTPDQKARPWGVVGLRAEIDPPPGPVVAAGPKAAWVMVPVFIPAWLPSDADPEARPETAAETPGPGVYMPGMV